MIKNKTLFYILSFTWGLPMTLVGCVAAAALRALGYQPKKWGYCYYFEVGRYWGGVNFGPIFVVSKDVSDSTKNHEVGHAIQGCWFGPLMPFIVSIPSAIRYWYRVIREKVGKPCKTRYDDIWFERQATKCGNKFINYIWQNL